jgi:hypothetical protein
MGTNVSLPGGSKSVRTWLTRIAVFLLWLATSALGLVVVGLSREIVYGIYARFGADPNVANALGQGVFFFLALVWLVYTIGTGEYHVKNAGRPSSWTILGGAVTIELLCIILYFVVAV